MSSDLKKQRELSIRELREDATIRAQSRALVTALSNKRYTYNFDWMGIPMIQCPQDVVALQEIVWRTRPDIIIETGVAYGGSLVMFASFLKLLGNGGRVVGVDILIKPENRAAITSHPTGESITLIEGSSTDAAVVARVHALIPPNARVMVVLDSNHTHDHVLAELEAYAPMVTKDCYLVVMDSVIEVLPESLFEGKNWGKGNNPMTAAQAFLKTTDRFIIDSDIDGKLVLTVAENGYLRCVK